MSVASLLQYAVFLVIATLLVRPAGVYLQRVFERSHTWLDPVLVWVERFIYRLAHINPEARMDWRAYATSFVVFTLAGTALLAVILLSQSMLPFYDSNAIKPPR